MNDFKPNMNWELTKRIKKCEYNYQTADSVDVFTYSDSQESYVLKILPLSETKSFESEGLTFKILNSDSESAECFHIFSSIHIGSYKNTKAEVYYVIYKYAGENNRDSKGLTCKQKIKIWNTIVQQKCRMLLFLISQGIMHGDPTYDNWVIQWEADGNDVNVKVNLIDFGLAIKLYNNGNMNTFVPIIKSEDVFNISHEEAVTNRELLYLLDSLSYDLRDVLNITHDDNDNENIDYGIFTDIKKRIDEFRKITDGSGSISLNMYKKILCTLMVALSYM